MGNLEKPASVTPVLPHPTHQSSLSHRFKTFRLFLTLGLIGGGIWLAVIAYDRGFTRKWRDRIITELEKYGIAAEIERLTIDPVNGLTARNVSFYDLANRRHRMASISNISLDLDLGKLVEGEGFLRTVDLRRAALSLPVDPDAPEGPALELSGINARLHFSGDRVDIARAEADISGIRVNVRGSIDLPKHRQGSPEEMEAWRLERERQLLEIKKRRGLLRDVLGFLDKFKGAGNTKAIVNVQVNGPLADFHKLQANVRVQAEKLTCGSFQLQRLRAEADISDGMVSLRELDLEDPHGKLKGQAFWRIMEDEDIDFWLDSSVDAHALLKGLWDLPGLGEVVFYQPPQVHADGKYLLNQKPGGFKLPLKAVARVDCRRFTSHGVIFDGFHGDLAMNADAFYVRNLLLEHESGQASGTVMRTAEGGVKYHLKWNIKLNAALPFVEEDSLQQMLSSFSFQKDGAVNLEAMGAGPDLDPATWTGSVQGELRNFSYKELPIKLVRADVTLAAGKCILRNALLQRPEGEVRIAQLNITPADHIFEVQGLVSTTQPLPLVKTFLPWLQKSVEPYAYDAPPTLKVDGIIHGLDSIKSDLMVHIHSPAPCSAIAGGEKYNLTTATGTLHWKDDILRLDLTAKGVAGMNHSGVTCEREPDLKFNGDFGVGKNLGKISSWKLVARSAEDVKIAIGGKQIPAQNLVATVTAENSKLEVEATGRVYGGAVAGNFGFPDVTKPEPYMGAVSVEKISYAQLAKLFDPNSKTLGELSGYLNFTAKGSAAASIKGTGRIVINDGDIFAIPLLGPLSKIISTLLPVGKLIYSVAREASADIVVEKGVARTDKFEAQTTTFKLLVSGMVDFLNDRVDMTARMNLRGAPGLLLFPVSKLFEYEALGTMGEPGWQPKHIGIPFVGDKERPMEKPVEENR